MPTQYTRDRGFSRARRLGRDAEDEGRQELQELIDDPDANFGDLLAAVIEQAPEDRQDEVSQAVRELGEDRRGPRSWAADRMERRRLGRDIAARRGRDRRVGGDDPPPFEGRPRPGGGMDPIDRDREFDRDAADRRRSAMDSGMAFDSSPRGEFASWFPGAARIERF